MAWKLSHATWNLGGEPTHRPRILFLADRNILADQAYNAFSAFQPDALGRISPDEIRRQGKIPKNASVFFTIFQTFMTGTGELTFQGYSPDFFDLTTIDECHRGGANDESSWRGILEYFAPAVQLGLTATPKRDANADTYAYFGEPVYTYAFSLEEQQPMKLRRPALNLALMSVAMAALSGCGMFKRHSELECMGRAMYFESHRSSRDGMVAVGSVVMNRVGSRPYPSTVCGVVSQKNQFAPGVMTRRMDERSEARVREAAVSVLRGERHPLIGKAQFFHAAGYRADYNNMHYVLTTGGNAFYERRRPEHVSQPVPRPAIEGITRRPS